MVKKTVYTATAGLVCALHLRVAFDSRAKLQSNLPEIIGAGGPECMVLAGLFIALSAHPKPVTFLQLRQT